MMHRDEQQRRLRIAALLFAGIAAFFTPSVPRAEQPDLQELRQRCEAARHEDASKRPGNVHTSGDLDLGKLAKRARLRGKTLRTASGDEIRLFGIDNPRTELGLTRFEADDGAPVGGLLVLDRELRLDGAVIGGDVVFAPERMPDGSVMVPVALRRITLRNTLVCGQLRLTGVRTQAGASFSGSTFLGGVSIENGRFAGSMVFGDVAFAARQGTTSANDVPEPAFKISRSEFRDALTLHCLTPLGAGDDASGRVELSHSKVGGDLLMGAIACADTRPEIPALGTVLLNNSRFTGKRLRIERLDVRQRLHAANAVFTTPLFLGGSRLAKAEFNNAVFEKGARFTGHLSPGWKNAEFNLASFGKADLVFADLPITERAGFTDVSFAGPVEVTDVAWQLADFREAVFEDTLAIHVSEIDRADFAGARFRQAVLMRSNRFGDASVAATGRATAADALDLSRAHFARGLDLFGSDFGGPVILAQISVNAQDLLFTWKQLRGLGRAADDESLYRLLQTSLRARGDLAGANEALYLQLRAAKDGAGEAPALAGIPEPTLLDTAHDTVVACRGGHVGACLWGYGVRPLRVAFWLAVLTGITILVLLLPSFVTAFLDRGPDLRFQPGQLPLSPRPSSWSWQRVRQGISGQARVLSAVFAGLQIATGVGVVRAVAIVDPGSPQVWALWILRVAGMIALGALVLSIGQSVPVVGDLLSFILPG